MNILLMHLYSLNTDSMLFIEDLCQTKLTLCLLGKNPLFFHNADNIIHMFQGFFPCPIIDDNIVKEQH
jgi:hypothetical protein